LADRGAGVLLVVLNHEGDVLSGTKSMELMASVNQNVRMLRFGDDISTGTHQHPENRRGLAGFLPLLKILGAAAEQGQDLDALLALGRRIEREIATLAVAVRSGTHPLTGQEFFFLGEDELGVGMGAHGEEGTARLAMGNADSVCDHMLDALQRDIALHGGDQVIAILNGSGATTLMEMFIVFRHLHHRLAEQSIHVARSRIGEFHTTQDQAGFSMTLLRTDEELLSLWDAPCNTPYLTVS
jgi:dihydroxyacetone kinase-like protein